jgi:predicted XRE-type DNA-binding protein
MQNQPAARLGVDPPKVSALLRGRLNDFSTDRLLCFITAMNHAPVSVHPPNASQKATVRVIC